MNNFVVDELVENIDLNHSSDYCLDIDIKTKHQFTINVAADSKCNLFLNLVNCQDAILNIKLEDNSKANIFYYNQAESSIHLSLNVDVQANAQAILSLAQFNQYDSNIQVKFNLNEEYAQAKIASSSLVSSSKKLVIECEHKGLYTISNMDNYAVALEDGDLELVATGKILKGAIQSKSHQKSKALTFKQQKNALIIPQLLIDENDVEASHATSVGQIDENQMYYLQSRGLSREYATRLITVGYLLPIVDNIENEMMRKHYEELIAKKVEEIC